MKYPKQDPLEVGKLWGQARKRYPELGTSQLLQKALETLLRYSAELEIVDKWMTEVYGGKVEP